MRKKKEIIPKNFLQIGMTLSDRRYRIDSLIGDNGLTVTYKGFDTFRNKVITIRELFPQSIMKRDIDNDYKVECKKLADESLFLSMKEHLIRKARKLIKMYPVQGIANILNFIEEHDTVYIIEEYIDGMTLDMFFKKRHSVKFTVDDIMKYMSPVMDTLSRLHATGIYHGAIYPENIRLLPGNKPILLGIMNPMEDVAAESLNDPKIRKDGFSPVELYITEAQKGPATDIYEVAAIFYNYVTGQPLPAYYERINEEKQTYHPADMLTRVPKFQGDAIMKATSVYHFDRFQSLDEFKKAIYPAGLDNDGLYVDENTVKNLKKKPFWYAYEQKQMRIYWIILLSIVMIGVFVLAPRVYNDAQQRKLNRFYARFNDASIYDQCEILSRMDKKEREFFVNDYKDLNPDLTDEERAQKIVPKYYDIIIEKCVSYGKVNFENKVNKFMKIDIHSNTTTVTYISASETKSISSSLKKEKDGSYKVYTEVVDEYGKSKSEIVYAKP